MSENPASIILTHYINDIILIKLVKHKRATTSETLAGHMCKEWRIKRTKIQEPAMKIQFKKNLFRLCWVLSLWHMGSSSRAREPPPPPPCIGSTESQPLDHQRNP